MNSERNKPESEHNNSAAKPDPETLHTTDPQKKMEGPVSSLMHDTGEAFDNDKSKEQADDKRESGF